MSFSLSGTFSIVFPEQSSVRRLLSFDKLFGSVFNLLFFKSNNRSFSKPPMFSGSPSSLFSQTSKHNNSFKSSIPSGKLESRLLDKLRVCSL